MLRAWLQLARVSNLPTVWTNVTAAWLLAGGSRYGHDGWDGRLGWLLLGGSLIYTGGMILNDAADVKFDREHRRERPIPSGLVGAAAAWAVGAGMLLFGWYFSLRYGYANFFLVTALPAAILLYDLYHKPWPGAVWVMGACRSLLYLTAASALIPDAVLTSGESRIMETSRLSWVALNHLDARVIPWAITLGLYVVGLTMVARQESRGTPVPLLRALVAKALLYAPGILAAAQLLTPSRLKPVTILGDLNPLAPAILIFVFAAMVAYAGRLMRLGGSSIGQAVGILLAGIAVVDALAVSQVSLSLAFGFAALAPLLRVWQRKIAAT